MRLWPKYMNTYGREMAATDTGLFAVAFQFRGPTSRTRERKLAYARVQACGGFAAACINHYE
jgi:hypothetical protein